MKLYYAPGACSLSPHIALREAGLSFDLARVDLQTHRLADGGDFHAVNAKGSVPVLEMDDGQRLTEGPVIVQYIADRAPAAGLAPAADSIERYRLGEWLNFISAEIHKTFSPLFNPAVPEQYKTMARERLANRFDWLAGELDGRDFLLGERFSVADGYLFTVLGWSEHMGIDMTRWPVLIAYLHRVAARPKVAEALQAEGLAG